MSILRRPVALVAAGLVAGAALGVTGFATAASPSPSPASPYAGSRPGPDGPDGHRGFGRGPGFRDHRFGGYGGLVTAVDANSLTVRSAEGTRTITLTSSTAYYRGITPATRSAITPGEVVRVRLADPRATTKVASVVAVVPARIGGWVTKVDGSTVTVTDRDGFTRTIRTSGSTTYEKDGATATSSIVTVGALIEAVGAVDADGTTLDAARVLAGRPDVRPGPPPAA